MSSRSFPYIGKTVADIPRSVGETGNTREGNVRPRGFYWMIICHHHGRLRTADDEEGAIWPYMCVIITNLRR